MKKINLIIDSSAIIGENFFTGKKINRLSTLGNEDKIQIYLTEIIDEEIKSNISKSTLELKSELNKINRILNNKYKFIKNVYPEINIDSFISSSFVEYEILNKYERFKKFAKIKIIPPQDNFNIREIMGNYFNSQPPFDNPNKKNEFPDAISYKIANDYFEKNKSRAYFIAKDNDFNNLKSDFLDKKKDFDFIFEEIALNNKSSIFEERSSILDSIIKNSEKYIPIIESELSLNIRVKLEILFYKHNIDILVHKIYLNQDILNYEIFDITEKQVGFKVIGKFNTELEIHTNSENSELTNTVLEKEELKLNKNHRLNFSGKYEIRFYFEYEFPYQITEHNLTFEEEDDIVIEMNSI